MFLIAYHSMLQMLLEAPFLRYTVICRQTFLKLPVLETEKVRPGFDAYITNIFKDISKS